MLRRLAGAAAAPLRTAASRPSWALTYRMAPLGATRAPPTGARASFDLNEAACASRLPLVNHFPDGICMELAAASRDGLDFVDSRRLPLDAMLFVYNLLSGQLFRLPVPSMDVALTTTPFGLNEATCASHLPLVNDFPDGIGMDLAAANRDGLDFVDTRHRPLDATLFVYNPLSGQLFRLPVPSMDAALTTTPFGLLTQSRGSPFSDGIRFTTASIRDGILLMDFSDTRRCPAGICNCCACPGLAASGAMSDDRLLLCAETRHAAIGNRCDSPGMAACAVAVEPGLSRFVCNPLSGPDAATTPFGLLTHTEGEGPHFADGIVYANIRSVSRDGLLYRDFANPRRCVAAICNFCRSPGSAAGAPMSHDSLLLCADTRHAAIGNYCHSPSLAPRAAAVELGVRRFVCKPLSRQLPDLHSCPLTGKSKRWYSHAPPRPLIHGNFSTNAAAPSDADPCLLPFWWWPPDKRESVWIHVVGQDEEGQRFHPLDFVTQFPPVDSVQIFGEYGPTDKTNKIGLGIISSFIVLWADMKLRDYSFYDPVKVDSFSIDQFGRVQIANGVLLRRASKTSSEIDTILAADALDQILSHGHQKPLQLPEVYDLLQKMRSPWRPRQGYSLLVHTSAMPEQIRGHAVSNAFELLMHSMTENERNIVLSHVWATGWGDDAQSNLVLAQYYYYRDSQFNPDDPQQLLVYCRNSESHILSYIKKLKEMGISYTKEDHQRLMHAKFWKLLCQLYQALWEYRMFKWVNPEDHFCGGACCPLTVGCVRNRCFLKEVGDESMPNNEWADTCLRIVHRIKKKNAKIYNSYLIEARYGIGDSALECTEIICKIIHIVQPNKVCPAPEIYFKVLDAPYSFKAWNNIQLTVTKGELLEVRYKHGRWAFVKKVGPCVGRRAGLVPARFFKNRLWL